MEVDFVDNESMRKKGQENILDDEKDAVWLSSILRYNKRLTFVTGQRLIQNSFLIIVWTYIIIGLFMMQFENLAEYESIDRTKKNNNKRSHIILSQIFWILSTSTSFRFVFTSSLLSTFANISPDTLISRIHSSRPSCPSLTDILTFNADIQISYYL